MAKHLEAEREVRVDGGVADLATETHIYEVYRLAKWHEDVGQVLHYRDDSGKQVVLVLILPDGYSNWVRLEKLERKGGGKGVNGQMSNFIVRRWRGNRWRERNRACQTMFV